MGVRAILGLERRGDSAAGLAHPTGGQAVQPRDSSIYIPPSGLYASALQLTTIEAAGLSAVRRCITLIANAVAGREWQEWEGTRRLDSSRMVLRPAAGMTRRDWTWRVVASMALYDLAYIWMVGGVDDEGVPGSLVPVPNLAVNPAGPIDPWDILAPAAFTISQVPGRVPGEAILRIRGPIWPGVPPHLQGILAMARNTMSMAWNSDAYASRYWAAGGTPITQITTDQELSDTQAETIGARWRDRRAKGPDYPAVMGKGAHADPYGADPTTQTAVEARRDMVTDVARLFGVPAHLALAQTPAGSGLTYTNVEDEGLSLDRYTLGGYVDPIQDAISGLLPGGWQGGRRMLIDMGPLTRSNQATRFAAWSIALGGRGGERSWMTQQEVRAAEGLPPIDPAELIVPADPAPAPTPAATAPEGAPADAGGDTTAAVAEVPA